jgi:hypothetical protein
MILPDGFVRDRDETKSSKNDWESMCAKARKGKTTAAEVPGGRTSSHRRSLSGLEMQQNFSYYVENLC